MKMLALASTLLASGSLAFAAAVPPSYDTFDDLPVANWGGSGIPTKPAAVSTIDDGGATITLGLIAHQRYSNPALLNDGAGTYFAPTGANYGNPANPGGPGPSAFLGATWNFGFFVNVANGNFSDYTFLLNIGTPTTSATIDLATILDFANDAEPTKQDSQNLLFAQINAALGGTFDPNAEGLYSIEIEALKNATTAPAQTIGTVSINVQTVPDAGSTVMLLGVALTGVAGLRRKFGV